MTVCETPTARLRIQLFEIEGRFHPLHRLWRMFSTRPNVRIGSRAFRRGKIGRLPLWIGLLTAIVMSIGAWALIGWAFAQLIHML